MIVYLLAPTALRIAPDDFPGRVRARFASELRRAGRFAQLCLLGAQACLDAAGGDGPLAVLWASEFGALHATRAALDEGLRRGEPAMPFAFIAAQPHLAGALLAQRSHPVTRTACLYLAADAWPSLPQLAQRWLAECDRVLVGCVEESGTLAQGRQRGRRSRRGLDSPRRRLARLGRRAAPPARRRRRVELYVQWMRRSHRRKPS